MKTNCEFDGCPCGGTGWVEQKKNTVFHQCLEHKNKTHMSLNAVAKCRYCKLKRSWQTAVGRFGDIQQKEENVIVYDNLSIRMRTVATRPTVSGMWHTIKTFGGILEIRIVVGDASSMIVIDNQYELDMHRITCALQQDVLTIALQQDSSTSDCVVILVDGDVHRPIECIAIQFPNKHTAIEAHNLISSHLSATTTTAAISLPQVNLLQLMLDPTIDPLVQQAELILATNDSALLPKFTQTLEFDRLCSKVDDILARITTSSTLL